MKSFAAALVLVAGAATADPPPAVPTALSSVSLPIANAPSGVGIAAASGDDLALAAKTVIDIEIAENISSRTAKVGDSVALRLPEPVKIGDRLILPIGTMGRGEVSHVARARWGGKPGELIVMARYLQCGDQKIPIGHFHFGASGESHLGAAFGAEMIVPFSAFLINGDEMLVSAGTRGNARISADMILTPTVAKQCAAT